MIHPSTSREQTTQACGWDALEVSVHTIGPPHIIAEPHNSGKHGGDKKNGTPRPNWATPPNAHKSSISSLFAPHLAVAFTHLFSMSSPTHHEIDLHHYTPQTARVRTLYNDAAWSYRHIESHTAKQGYRIPKIIAWRIDYRSSARRLKNDINREETRGRKTKLSREDVAYIDRILKKVAFDERAINWEMLRYECNLNVSVKTLQRELH